MPKAMRRSFACLLLAVSALFPVEVGAAETVVRLTKRLGQEKDFRVRTQAALALGSSKSAAAVKPLCSALADPNATVRAAAAAALSKLNRGGVDCLARRLSAESNDRVRASLKRALATLEPGPTIDASSKYYVTLAEAKAGGSEGDARNTLLCSTMRQAAKSVSGLVLAPQGEVAARATELLRKHKQLRGFYLAPKVFAPKYQSGSLKVKVEIAVFSYPAQSLLGSFSVDLTTQAASEGDTETENTLIKMLAERALKKFTTNAEQF
ncbi:MAG: HEAT repeat domain-containing protein [Polyangiaceae bacterium]|nr:HEAT repeat domain-containing protein [Polyangiaceae bacterium]